ncbi:MAG: TolC family protein [Elusimicrobiaceae bacterium]|nr:TolC family protein [Elusimicrobiaceae bacterium]
MRNFNYFLLGMFLFLSCGYAQAEVVSAQSNSSQADSSSGIKEPVPLGADGQPLQLIYDKLTLQQCIDLALANSPSMVSAQIAEQNAQINVNLAKAQFLPTASAGFSSNYNMGTPGRDYGSSNVYANANLSLSGVTDIARNIKMKQVELEQAQLNLQSVQNDIVRNVRKKYYVLLAAQRTVDIRTQSRDVYKDQYERTAEYYRLGLRPKVDVTTAEVNLNNESLRLIRATNAVKTASAALANTLGVTTSAILNVDDDVSFDTLDLSFEQAIKNAYENRPDVASSGLDVRLSELRLNQAKSGLFPTISFSGGYTKSGDTLLLDTEAAHIGVSLEIPIFNAFKTYNGIKQAKLAVSSAQNQSRSLLNNVFLEVQNAYILMQEAAESIPLAELNAEKAKENMELARGRYNEGIGDMISLKDAEAAYTDAEISLLSARYDYGAAVADLKQAMGTY